MYLILIESHATTPIFSGKFDSSAKVTFTRNILPKQQAAKMFFHSSLQCTLLPSPLNFSCPLLCSSIAISASFSASFPLSQYSATRLCKREGWRHWRMLKSSQTEDSIPGSPSTWEGLTFDWLLKAAPFPSHTSSSSSYALLISYSLSLSHHHLSLATPSSHLWHSKQAPVILVHLSMTKVLVFLIELVSLHHLTKMKPGKLLQFVW